MRNYKFVKLGILSTILILGACRSEPDIASSKIEEVEIQDTLAVMFANTMVVTAKDGTVQNWMFNKDGTLDSLENVTGTWEFDGETLCTLYGERTKPGCWVLPQGKTVGDTWELVVGSGKTLQISIVEGR